MSATANAGYPFTGFSGGLTGTPNPQNVTMNSPVSVLAIFGANSSVTAPPSAPAFSVNGTACTGVLVVSCAFEPRGADTLTATQIARPTGGPVPRYKFSTTDGSLAPQEIAAPFPGEGDNCSWIPIGGVFSTIIPIGSPRPAPVINSVTLDAAGRIPAVIVPGSRQPSISMDTISGRLRASRRSVPQAALPARSAPPLKSTRRFSLGLIPRSWMSW